MNVDKVSGINQLSLKTNQLIPFKAKETSEDTFVKEEGKKRSLTAKKWGVGLVGPFYGNLINGNPKKAFGYLGAMAGITAVTLLTILTGKKSFVPRVITALGILSGIGLAIYGIVDCVKNVKPDKE